MPPNFGILPDLAQHRRDKKLRYQAYRDRALADLTAWKQEYLGQARAIAS
jgi:methylenetetrahydrofolate--tRNA-(uracil-5-)-methyltransferase